MIPGLIQKVTVWTLIIRKTTSRITPFNHIINLWTSAIYQASLLMMIIICQAHLLANPLTIPLMYNLILWNNFLIKKEVQKFPESWVLDFYNNILCGRGFVFCPRKQKKLIKQKQWKPELKTFFVTVPIFCWELVFLLGTNWLT